MARSTYVARTFSLAHMRCVRTTRQVCAVERSKGGRICTTYATNVEGVEGGLDLFSFCKVKRGARGGRAYVG